MVLVGIRAISFDSGVNSAASKASETAEKDAGFAEYFELVADAFDVVGTGFESDLHELLFTELLFTGRIDGENEQAFAFEEVGDAVRGSELSTVDLEDLANLGSRSIAIVSHDFAQDRDSTWPVPFVENLVDVAAIEFPVPF